MYGIFHGTGNSARFCQNFGIISGGGFEPPNPPLGTPVIYGAPCKARNVYVIYIYGPSFANTESCLFLFAAKCLNTESMQKVILWHSCV
jgi:hypothetical protein